MTDRPYQVCVRCVMDTTDPSIEFDENGYCNHCREYEKHARLVPSEPERKEQFDSLIRQIKAEGKGKEYDCIIGVSGGVDSTYTAYLVKSLGLRPLAIHVDNGWDSELAVNNVKQMLDKLGIDLQTLVLDWNEFKDLQISFLKASTSDSEIPSDHAILAGLYQAAARKQISYVISGSNRVTESILPKTWTYGAKDWRYIQGIQRRFGRVKLKTFPHISFFDQYVYYKAFRKVRFVSIFDYVMFNKQYVIQLLEKEFNWKPYGGKHHESIYTRFFQGYILPRKFNIDKRKAHMSCLIMAGQMTREDALKELQEPPYAGYTMEDDMEYVSKKLGLSGGEFEQIMSLPPTTHAEYQTAEDYPGWYYTLADLMNGRLIYKMATSLPKPVVLLFIYMKRAFLFFFGYGKKEDN
jgi:N-acetyl sugar amidotransferase